MKTTSFSRRRLLGGMTASALLSRLGSIQALAQTSGAPSDYKALVCILLAGGNDGHSTIVPLTQSAYNTYKAVRGTLALPDSNGPVMQVQTPDGTPYALNNGLRHISPLWSGTSAAGSSGALAVLANVGMLVEPVTRAKYLNPQQSGVKLPTNLFSHADQVQQMQSGIAASTGGTGWGGRAADSLQGLNGAATFPAAVSLSGPSLYCTGNSIRSTSLFPGFNCDMAGMSLWPQSAANARQTGVQQLLQFDSGLTLVQAANKSRKDAMDLNGLLTSGLASQLTTPFPTTSIGQQLEQVARLIAIRSVTGMSRQVFFCSLGSFDTHGSQSWQQWDLLSDLTDAMNTFYTCTQNDLQIPDKVTTFTISDFGRTLQPSGSGTDHGWGNHHMIMGGAVKGGNVYGTFPDLSLNGPDDSGSRGALVPSTSIAQYGATLARWFGVQDGVDMNTVFPTLPNFTIQDLGFMG